MLYRLLVVLLPELVSKYVWGRGIAGFCFETRSCFVALASLEVSVDQVGLELSDYLSVFCWPVLVVTGATATVLGSELLKEEYGNGRINLCFSSRKLSLGLA